MSHKYLDYIDISILSIIMYTVLCSSYMIDMISENNIMNIFMFVL